MKNIYLICLVALALSMQSCEKWLSVQPTDRQTELQIFTSKGGCYSAVNGIYTKLNSETLYGRDLSYDMIECLAQRWFISEENIPGHNFQRFSYSAESSKLAFGAIWDQTYNLILNCNIVLKNIELKKEMLGVKDYNIIKGEMLGLRAFLHFDLLRLFGPIYATNPQGLSIPYSSQATVNVTDILPADQVINDHIMVDLNNAEKILEQYDPVLEKGPMSASVTSETEIYNEDNIYKYRQLRFNYYAVLLMKARVQLYAGNKAEALILAKSIIDSPKVQQFFPSVDPVLVKDNLNPDRVYASETFFGMYDKNKNLKFKESFDPVTARHDLLQPRATYMRYLFYGMPNDYRNNNQWIFAANDNSILIKYKDIADMNLFYATFTPLLRLSEAYLIAAETEPDVLDGLKYINKLRVDMRGNVGLALDLDDDEEEFIYQLTREYIREFAGEGQLFYFYKRRNENIAAGDNGAIALEVRWKDDVEKLVIALPESELLPR